MPLEPEADADAEPSEVRPLSRSESEAVAAARAVPGAPLFEEPLSRRSRYLSRVLIAIAAVGLLAFLGYQKLAPPADDGGAWTPPSGLSAEETPHWLQTLCADRTPELCAAADRARSPSDCEAMREALRALESVERELSARGALSAKQRWVLIELYGQGHELCEFERTQPRRDPAQ
jgi:hypothetical protein